MLIGSEESKGNKGRAEVLVQTLQFWETDSTKLSKCLLITLWYMRLQSKHKEKTVGNNQTFVLVTGSTTFCATEETIICQLLGLVLLFKDVLKPFRPDPHLPSLSE